VTKLNKPVVGRLTVGIFPPHFPILCEPRRLALLGILRRFPGTLGGKRILRMPGVCFRYHAGVPGAVAGVRSVSAPVRCSVRYPSQKPRPARNRRGPVPCLGSNNPSTRGAELSWGGLVVIGTGHVGTAGAAGKMGCPGQIAAELSSAGPPPLGSARRRTTIATSETEHQSR
jgi:hypothetical protein